MCVINHHIESIKNHRLLHCLSLTLRGEGEGGEGCLCVNAFLLVDASDRISRLRFIFERDRPYN